MHNQLLQRFNGDIHQKEAVLAYCVAFFEDEIIKRAKRKESVESLADAIVELERAFENLSIEYGIKETNETSNHSR